MTKLVCVLLISLMVGAAPGAEAAFNCATVLTRLSSCLGYLKTGGAPPLGCCDGLKSLYDEARKTTADIQTACTCVKSLVPAVGANPEFVNSVGGKCGVDIPYKYSPDLDCSKYASPSISSTIIFINPLLNSIFYFLKFD